MGNKKKIKKVKEDKDMMERTTEVVEMRKKLRDLGINKFQVPDVEQFINILEEYRLHGTLWKGKIKLTGTKRVIEGFLTNTKGKKLQIKLTYNPSI